jgi:hypothetical protein
MESRWASSHRTKIALVFSQGRNSGNLLASYDSRVNLAERDPPSPLLNKLLRDHSHSQKLLPSMSCDKAPQLTLLTHCQFWFLDLFWVSHKHSSKISRITVPQHTCSQFDSQMSLICCFLKPSRSLEFLLWLSKKDSDPVHSFSSTFLLKEN